MVDIDGVISLFGIRRVPRSSGQAPRSASRRRQGPSTRSTAYRTSFRPRPRPTCRPSRPTSTSCGPAAGRRRPRSTCHACSTFPRACPSCASSAPPAAATRHWKLAAIEEFAGSRALAWIDDALNAACHDWAGTRPAPTLLVQTAPERGLTSVEAQLLADWARDLSPATNRRSRLARTPDHSSSITL